jgi:hypothetical protein
VTQVLKISSIVDKYKTDVGFSAPITSRFSVQVMTDEKGKWLPFNEDGSLHECKKTNGTDNKNEVIEPISKSNVNLDLIIDLLNRSIVELEKIRSVKH